VGRLKAVFFLQRRE